jgi:hypothetical protein
MKQINCPKCQETIKVNEVVNGILTCFSCGEKFAFYQWNKAEITHINLNRDKLTLQSGSDKLIIQDKEIKHQEIFQVGDILNIYLIASDNIEYNSSKVNPNKTILFGIINDFMPKGITYKYEDHDAFQRIFYEKDKGWIYSKEKLFEPEEVFELGKDVVMIEITR